MRHCVLFAEKHLLGLRIKDVDPHCDGGLSVPNLVGVLSCVTTAVYYGKLLAYELEAIGCIDSRPEIICVVL